jgi:predicted nucleic acid-binding protein
MRVEQALKGVKQLFLDTAPVIYYVERHPNYFPVVQPIFQHLQTGDFKAVASPITLAECLTLPYRQGLTQLQQDFIDVIVAGENTIFQPTDAAVGCKAAEVRGQYQLKLPDALQIATALIAECDSFLTNDRRLESITELEIIVIENLEV